jgi:hypothetical protein
MNPIFEPLTNLLGYSVPTILVLAGVFLFFLSYFKNLQPTQVISSKIYGFIIGIAGILLALIIRPAEPQPQLIPAYIFPPQEIVISYIPDDKVTEIKTTGIQPSIATEMQHYPMITIEPALSLSNHTPEPSIIVIPVWAIEENGVRVNISSSGVYKISYLDDAYSPWPNEQYEGYRGWTTIVRIYINRTVEWGKTEYGLIGPINFDGYLSKGGYYLDKEQAIASAAGDSRTFRLNAADYLILVTVDEKGRYSDNQGKVDIGITYLGQ